jgi:hypothetical protein
MSFLDKNISEFLTAKLTQEGRKSIANGDFKIDYFSVGDSEFNYTNNVVQSVLTPMDRDGHIKYPLKYNEGVLTGTTPTTIYGIPITGTTTETISNVMGPAGFVSGSVFSSGSLVVSGSFSSLTGNTTLDVTVPSGSTFSDSQFVTLMLGGVSGTTITGNTNSFTYKLKSVTGSTTQTLTFDRPVPILTGLTGNFKIVGNKVNNEFIGLDCSDCLPPIPDSTDQHDSWKMNIVWSKNPIGFSGTTTQYTGFTSSKHLSTKEFFGYQSSNGQLYNTGTTYANSFATGQTDSSNVITLLPEEQNAIAIIHYSEVGDIVNNPDRAFTYDDYISTNTGITSPSTISDINYFEIYIPYINYHRNTGTTIGAKFHMGTTDKYVVSKLNETSILKYRDLLDERNFIVGKIFYNKKVIVFDDQEIVAVLDHKSNRRYTLPTSKLGYVSPTGTTALLSGTTGTTLYVSYILTYEDSVLVQTTGNKLTGLPCNQYVSIDSTTTDSNVIVKFNGGFNAFKTSFPELTGGTVATNFYILAQKQSTGVLPNPTQWKKIDFSSGLSAGFGNHLINPANITNFTITKELYDSASPNFNLSEYLIGTTLSEFGDEQPFPGSIKMVRATDIEEMKFLVNLPASKFHSSQNPTYVSGDPKITEVALLNSNKKALVIAKTATPISRVGSQVFSVKLDF